MDSISSGSVHLRPFAPRKPICSPFNPLPLAPVSFSRVTQVSTLRKNISAHCLYKAPPNLRWSLNLMSRKFVVRAFDCHDAEFYTTVYYKRLYSSRSRLRFDSSMLERVVSGGGITKSVFLADNNTWNKPRLVRTGAFNPQGGGDGTGRVVFNLAVAGVLTYLTFTGKLNWLFEAILYIWIFLLVLFWLAERNLVRGRCPSCGGEFQVLEFSFKDEPRLCPYCSQPFKMQNKQFVREGPQFSNERPRDSKSPFGGFGRQASSTQEQRTSDAVVDIEAEVRDKD